MKGKVSVWWHDCADAVSLVKEGRKGGGHLWDVGSLEEIGLLLEFLQKSNRHDQHGKCIKVCGVEQIRKDTLLSYAAVYSQLY